MSLGLSEKRKKGKGGLNRLFLNMTVLPVVLLGLVIMVLDYGMYSKGLHEEVQRGLGAIAQSVLSSYEDKYPGDFNLLVDEVNNIKYLRKGEVMIGEDTALIDSIKAETGIDISVFFWDTRMMTTITDENGERVTGTVVNDKAAERTLKEHQETFFDSVQVGGREYFAEYIPVYSESGVCLGMIGAAKPVEAVAAAVNRSMVFNIVCVVLLVILVSVVVYLATNSIVKLLSKVERFLGEMAKGNLSAKMDETVLSREDEIGVMAQFTVHVQGSLRKLIEKDPLTGLYNRRSGYTKINEARDRNSVFAVAMGDIDHFKSVNDTYGHDAGDEVLKSVARILGNHLAGKGFVARWGGEEFLMVFDGVDGSGAAEYIENMLNEIRGEVIECGEYSIKVTMSCGVTDGNIKEDIEPQIKRADNALYYAKTHGRNQLIRAEAIEGTLEEHPDNTV